MANTLFIENIIENRKRNILALIKKTKNIKILEQELALLAFDVVHGFLEGDITPRKSCKCFREIEYAIPLRIENKLSTEALDILHEGMLLEEAGTTYGPNPKVVLEAATKILNQAKEHIEPKLKTWRMLVPNVKHAAMV